MISTFFIEIWSPGTSSYPKVVLSWKNIKHRSSPIHCHQACAVCAFENFLWYVLLHVQHNNKLTSKPVIFQSRAFFCHCLSFYRHAFFPPISKCFVTFVRRCPVWDLFVCFRKYQNGRLRHRQGWFAVTIKSRCGYSADLWGFFGDLSVVLRTQEKYLGQ